MLHYPLLFQTTKIQIFESNSQLVLRYVAAEHSCFRQQRYKFLKAIHNHWVDTLISTFVVSDNKDTNFWKQFTTAMLTYKTHNCCFRQQRYKFLKAIHNKNGLLPETFMLFQTTKIQIFESNSQRWRFKSLRYR